MYQNINYIYLPSIKFAIPYNFYKERIYTNFTDYLTILCIKLNMFRKYCELMIPIRLEIEIELTKLNFK